MYCVYNLGQTPEEDGEDGLSKVAIVGIVIFCIAALIVLTVTVTVGVRHVWRSGKNKADSQVCICVSYKGWKTTFFFFH